MVLEKDHAEDALNHPNGNSPVVKKYGLLVKDRRNLRRAVFVVDRTGRLTHVAYMQHNGLEPNYDEVLEAAKAAL